MTPNLPLHHHHRRRRLALAVVRVAAALTGLGASADGVGDARQVPVRVRREQARVRGGAGGAAGAQRLQLHRAPAVRRHGPVRQPRHLPPRPSAPHQGTPGILSFRWHRAGCAWLAGVSSCLHGRAVRAGACWPPPWSCRAAEPGLRARCGQRRRSNDRRWPQVCVLRLRNLVWCCGLRGVLSSAV
eukprot:3889196-Rhodomonas_salina.5